MKKVVRGFEEGKGPMDVNKAENYQQKFRAYIEESFFEADENPRRFPHLVENFFQENLLRRYNLIKYLKAEIRREKNKNVAKRKIIED